MEQAKQVIVFRKDLLKGEHAIRKGKLAGQVAHASLGSLLKLASKSHEGDASTYTLSFKDGSVLDSWLNGIFTKVVVYVESEAELIALQAQCDAAGLPNALITDAGNTEFHGVPTVTCLGIGPCWNEDVDKITKDLKLL